MKAVIDTLRLQREAAAVAVIDIQERLARVMPDEVRERTVRQARILVAGARILGLPVLWTEQYPKGLGPTLKEIASEMPPEAAPLDKVEFSCAAAPGFLSRLDDTGRKQIILAGMEAHICVLQTALGLSERGYRVCVAEDAICSRVEANWHSAVRLLERAGCAVMPTESILFMLLGRAGTPEFKQVSALVK